MDKGLASRLENRMWYFGETEKQALDALAKIDEENAQNMEQELEMQTIQNNEQNSVDKLENEENKRRNPNNHNPDGIT